MAFERRDNGRQRDLRINRRIRVPEVRLIGSEGEQLGVFITSEALKRAEAEGMDLVEIAPTARPPVCRIMDYGKYKYEESKKKQQAKKQQAVVHLKEIKMRPATDEHDLQIKLKHIKEFLEDGDRVKVTMRFRGREMAHKDIGQKRMERVIEETKDLSEIFQPPKFEGKSMIMLLTPVKKK